MIPVVVNAMTERPDRGGNSEGQRLIPTIAGYLNSAGGHAVPGNSIQDVDQGYLQVVNAPPISLCLNAGAMGRTDAESETLIPTGGFFDANGGVMLAVAFDWQSGGDCRGLDLKDTAQLQRCQVPATQQGMQVRRLTPRECERLQGFPDDYTLTPYRGKPAADGPRYKALGNSMAVPVMAWIGKRIQQVETVAGALVTTGRSATKTLTVCG